jgi:hypothetical protein
MQVKFMILANSASIDQTSNQLSIFNVIEQISGLKFPAPSPATTLCMLLARETRDPDTTDFTLEGTISGNSQPLFRGGFTADFKGKKRVRIVAQIPPYLIPAPGTLTFALRRKNREIAAWSVDVAELALVEAQLKVASSPSQRSKKSSSHTTRKKRRKTKA